MWQRKEVFFAKIKYPLAKFRRICYHISTVRTRREENAVMKKTTAKKRINRKHIVLAIALVLVLLLLLLAFISAYIRNGGLFVDVLPRDGVSFLFLPVGQANCTLIFTDGGTLVIDTGSNDSEGTLLSAFSYYGVKSIEYIVLTHADEDHAGGLDAILDSYRVKGVMLTDSAYEELKGMREGRALEAALLSKKTDLHLASAGDALSLGSSHLEILTPSEQDEEISNGGNESSLIILFSYGETRAIFPGDADKAGELRALTTLAESHPKLSYDLLLVGHHGSSTSSCEQFIGYVAPRYAVISCGENNTYGHPNIEVLKRLESVGAEILRTDRDGTIILHSNGETMTRVSHVAELS